MVFPLDLLGVEAFRLVLRTGTAFPHTLEKKKKKRLTEG